MDLSLRTDTVDLPATTTRLVVLGDPHGDLAGLDGVLAREGGADVAFFSVGDNVGYAGGPTSSELCRRLRDRGVRSVSGNHEEWMRDDGSLAIVSVPGLPRTLETDALAWCAQLPFRLRVRAGAAPDLAIAVVHTIVEEGKRPRWDYVSAENANVVADVESADVVFVGHSHGPAIYVVARNGSVEARRLDLDADAPVRVKLARGSRTVVDAGSLARPGYHPEPGRFDRATYAVLDLSARTLSLHVFSK